MSFYVANLPEKIDAKIDSDDTGCRLLLMDGVSEIETWAVQRFEMRIAVTEVRWIEVRKPAKDRLAKAEKEKLCVACLEPLDGQEPIRGCHPKCYRATRRAIVSGKCTESQRVEAGKLLEKQEPGRKPSNPVSVETSN